MDATQILQTVLSVVQAATNDTLPLQEPGAAASANATARAPFGASTPGAPMGVAQLLVMLFSMSAVRDWAKLLLIGAVLEMCRRVLTKSWQSIHDYFWLTAVFELNDDTADWVLYWASSRKVFKSARHIEVTTWYFGLENTLDEFEEDDDKVAFYPALDKKYTTWYKGRYITIKREERNANSVRRPIQVLELRILSRNPKVLRDLLTEARKGYKAASQRVINVYVTEGSDRWQHVAVQEKRPASSVVLDPGVFELVLADARDFLQSKKWYSSRGIPFRRGYLLYGAPGAGKTSMIHSIAGDLGLSVYILSLTVGGLDDNSLKRLIAHLPERSILLIEDIDAAFHRGMKRNITDPEAQQAQRSGASGGNGQADLLKADGDKKDKQDTLFNGVTLSGLLNALDGIAAQEGRILFATTNDYSALDPALLRPGRLDLHIEFQLASHHQARELYKRFFTSDEDAADDASDDNAGSNSAAATPFNGSDPDSVSTPLLVSVDNSNAGEKTPAAAQSTPPTAPQLPESVRSAYVGMTHAADGLLRMSAKRVAELAEQFADIVPPRAFSMATLQGYLMMYKVRPLEAIADAPAWVQKRLQEKAAAAASIKEKAGTVGTVGVSTTVSS
ncbi:P-loop containing nucleoside triphosphate hydrolase protein [Trametes polyzona]|nr:P-loop containing nucleoside triphosphate hydrolase protein [Trametes polyzona]